MKKCAKCQHKKSIDCFYKDGADSLCKDCRKEENDLYYVKNKLVINRRHRRNARNYREQTATYHRNRYATDEAYKLKKILSGRIYKAVSRGHKSFSSVKLLGCSIPELKIHLASQFQSGMTWDNYGDWHIDHRLPCASFDLSNPDEQKVCFHYTNLQPLWAKDNQSKADKVNK